MHKLMILQILMTTANTHKVAEEEDRGGEEEEVEAPPKPRNPLTTEI